MSKDTSKTQSIQIEREFTSQDDYESLYFILGKGDDSDEGVNLIDTSDIDVRTVRIVEFDLEPIASYNGDSVDKMNFSITFGVNADVSDLEEVESITVKAIRKGKVKIYKMSGVDPGQLFRIGVALIRIANYHGITSENVNK